MTIRKTNGRGKKLKAPAQTPRKANGRVGKNMLGGAILSAAMALPGMMPTANAESAPEFGVIGVKYLYYQDSQPGLDRVKVSAPSLYLMTPVGHQWAFAGSLVSDSVSGASPRYHSAISGASRMNEERHAGDAKLTRYFDRASLSIGAAYSSEHDYDSRAVNITGTLSSEDNNTTWTLGTGFTSDDINPVNNIVTDARKTTNDFMLGVTQVMTPHDIVQLNATYANARGYLNDPYKLFDNRPDKRRQLAVMARWNHYLEADGSTLKSSYRYYTDNYGIDGHTVGLDWVKSLADGVTVTPALRYHTQGAADFYYDPGPNDPLPPGFLDNPSGYYSPDQRLSAFGAITAGIKVAKEFAGGWIADLRFDYYQQRSNWRLFDDGSPGIDTFTSKMLQIGISKRI